MAFDAFISYSHAADGELAPALQRGLQQLAKPWTRRQALRIFRDDTGLSVNPALWQSITNALDESEYFVLLASPGAAQSEWVNREIAVLDVLAARRRLAGAAGASRPGRGHGTRRPVTSTGRARPPRRRRWPACSPGATAPRPGVGAVAGRPRPAQHPLPRRGRRPRRADPRDPQGRVGERGRAPAPPRPAPPAGRGGRAAVAGRRTRCGRRARPARRRHGARRACAISRTPTATSTS